MSTETHTNGNGSLHKAIANAAVLVSVILGLVAYNAPIAARQDAVEIQQVQLRDSMVTLVQSLHKEALKESYNRGKVDQQIADLRTATVKLDTDLQREMRDVNATTEAKLAGLDTRLQGEIANVTGVLSDNIERSKAEEKRLAENQLLNRENIGRLDERLLSIQKQLNGSK